MLRVDIPESDSPESQTQATVTEALEKFQVQDGDRIKISPILPFADKTVFLDGHVFRPGKYAYRDGMKITDLVHNYRDLLPEPYKQHAEIIRLSAPDYKPQVIAFNLEDALAGKDPDLTLKPFDTIRVFSRFDFEDPPIITISGEVRDPSGALVPSSEVEVPTTFAPSLRSCSGQKGSSPAFSCSADSHHDGVTP